MARVKGDHKPARSLDELERRIGITLSDHARLERALTHSSLRAAAGGARGRRKPGKAPAASASAEDARSYERLEFLGDRVLGLVIAQALFEQFPRADEGELSLRLNALVNADTCAEIADELGLYEFVRHGGDLTTLALERTRNIRADLTESLIAAIYLSEGLKTARDFVIARWADRLDTDVTARRDAKTALQEWVHTRGTAVPRYEIHDRSGPDHEPVFTVRVTVEGVAPGEGQGRSRRLAEQAAAEAVLIRESVWKDTP